jgi:hypothetical protein
VTFGFSEATSARREQFGIFMQLDALVDRLERLKKYSAWTVSK